jgi:alkaline phosphatase D
MVWRQIAEQSPDVLVLLGDSVYIDVPPQPDSAGHIHPSDPQYQDYDFSVHLHRLYQKQLAIPEFAWLISQPTLRTYAIWDDHDFLWNDADANFSQSVSHKGQAIYSSNLFECWREALSGVPFPASVIDSRVQQNRDIPLHLVNYDQVMPGYQGVCLLGDKIYLHLTDGRSWRKGKSLLGTAQRAQMEANIKTKPNAVHLVASGSTFGAKGSQGWAGYEDDYKWLVGLAAQYKVLILSGDIHKNHFSDPLPTSSTLKLFEATASGAAVDFLRVNSLGRRQGLLNYSERFGTLEFEDDGIQVSLFDHGVLTSGAGMKIPSTFK